MLQQQFEVLHFQKLPCHRWYVSSRGRKHIFKTAESSRKDSVVWKQAENWCSQPEQTEWLWKSSILCFLKTVSSNYTNSFIFTLPAWHHPQVKFCQHVWNNAQEGTLLCSGGSVSEMSFSLSLSHTDLSFFLITSSSEFSLIDWRLFLKLAITQWFHSRTPSEKEQVSLSALERVIFKPRYSKSIPVKVTTFLYSD